MGKAFYGVSGVFLVLALAALPVPVKHGLLDPKLAHVLAFGACLIGLAALAAALGQSTCGDWRAILKSGRNTYSLSRLQMALWTWLIFSALLTLVACRIWSGHIDTALDIELNGGLFAVMGISFISGAATPALLALKQGNDTDPVQSAALSQRMAEPMLIKGQVVVRPRDQPAKLSDIVKGDDSGSAGLIDLSKVQNLVLTFALLAVYGIILAHAFWTGFPHDGTTFPDVSTQMAELLGISHGAYLTYKAVPKPNADSSGHAIAYAGPPSTPNA